LELGDLNIITDYLMILNYVVNGGL